MTIWSPLFRVNAILRSSTWHIAPPVSYTPLDVYKRQGAYTAHLGGLDVLTFTAGVGENDEIVRRMVCEKLAPFGVKLDNDKNDTRSKEPRIISTPDSTVTVVVYPTNEELAIAQRANEIVTAGEDTYGNKI